MAVTSEEVGGIFGGAYAKEYIYASVFVVCCWLSHVAVGHFLLVNVNRGELGQDMKAVSADFHREGDYEPSEFQRKTPEV